MVMSDRDTKALRAWVLEHKGADLVETVDRAVTGVRELGYRGRVLIRCDGEPTRLRRSSYAVFCLKKKKKQKKKKKKKKEKKVER